MTKKEAKEYLQGGYVLITPEGYGWFQNAYKRVVGIYGSDQEFYNITEFLRYIDVEEAVLEDD